nr:retron system putative HNH endonuclease [uncultured Macellibacteroides sp.]
MRHIKKEEPIQAFLDFIHRGSHSNWNDIHDEVNYSGLYRKCRDQILIEEQDCMSGYTEIPLNTEGNIHIDHFKKKGMFMAETFNWNNFIVDSLDSGYGACYKDSRISNVSDYDKLINPVEEDPHDYFTYQSNGNIVPKSGLSPSELEKAEFTRATFNLNHVFLRQKRIGIMKMTESYIGEHTKEEIESALANCGFKSVIEYVCNTAE